MALSFSRPDPSSPDAVAGAAFSTGRRGFDQNEVRDFLRMVAAELARLQERERYLERELRTAQRNAPNPAIALDEEVVTRLLGEEAARILATSREAASHIKVRAEEAAARIVGEAADEGQRVREEAQIEAARRRQDAAADAESELEMAKQQGREMVNEARAYRERVLTELSRRRELARQQIEQLVHGRDRLVQAFERARLAAVDVMNELVPLGEPSEYVNLSPTTGPVPVMLPSTPRPEPEPLRMTFGVDDVPELPPDAVVVPDEEIVVETLTVVETDTVETDTVETDTVEPGTVEPATVEPATGEPEKVPTGEPEKVATGETGTGEPATSEPGTVEPGTGEVADAPEPVADAAQPAHQEAHEPDDHQAAASTVGEESSGDEAFAGDEAVPDQAGASSGDDEVEAPRVVSLFAGEMIVDEATPTADPARREVTVEAVAPDDAVTEDRTPVADADEHVDVDPAAVDDLFARLRAARAESVAERARMNADDAPAAPAAPAAAVEPEPDADATRALPRPDRFSVFEPSPVAPPADVDVDDSPFGRRDAALTPLIVTAARKLKRVLADEQNDVLHALRRASTVTALEPMLPTADEHATRYADVIATELVDAAVAGAASLRDGDAADLRERVRAADATGPAVAALVDTIVAPLRERMGAAVTDAGGDTTELATLARGVYREWKIQHIDERLDEIVRVAFGRGALAGVDPGTPVRWTHDPRVPVCADCDDNGLSGVIGAGEPFATGQPCAPAHEGCRCMLATDRG